MALRLITSPAENPVSLAEAKAHLRIDDDDQNGLIEMLISAAVSHLDGWRGILGRAIVAQTWELVLDEFPCGAVQLPLGPLISVTSVKYDDADGNEQTLSTDAFEVDTAQEPGWIIEADDASWPETFDAVNAVRIRFVAGLGATAADVPSALKVAILLLVSHWFENREASVIGQTVNTLPFAVDALISPYRRIGV